MNIFYHCGLLLDANPVIPRIRDFFFCEMRKTITSLRHLICAVELFDLPFIFFEFTFIHFQFFGSVKFTLFGQKEINGA